MLFPFHAILFRAEEVFEFLELKNDNFLRKSGIGALLSELRAEAVELA
jgi:hypothetical protein